MKMPKKNPRSFTVVISNGSQESDRQWEGEDERTIGITRLDGVATEIEFVANTQYDDGCVPTLVKVYLTSKDRLIIARNHGK